MYVPQQVLSSP